MGEPTSIEARRTWNTVIALVGIALLACVSSTIEGRGNGGAYAPANEQRGGSLRYYEGTKSRDDAYREMFTYCGGPYEIAAERDVNRGMTTNYSRYNTTTTASIEHVIDFRCVEQTPRTSSTVRLSGDEWRLARDWVIQNSGCPQANVDHEVASPTPGAKEYAVSACGQRWLCSAGNGMAVCGVDGSPAPAMSGGPPPPPPTYQQPAYQQPPPPPGGSPADVSPVPAL